MHIVLGVGILMIGFMVGKLTVAVPAKKKA